MAGVSARDNRTGQQLSFVNLRVHSAFSLLEGALPIDRIVEFAAADGAPAVGIADTGNLFGALDFAQKAVKAGIQPIIGRSRSVVACATLKDAAVKAKVASNKAGIR